MEIVEREVDGSKSKYHFDAHVYFKLDRISYNYLDFNSASEVNKSFIPAGASSLFELREDVIRKISEDSLFPAYYMIDLDMNATGPGYVDLVALCDKGYINKKEFFEHVDIQVMNNLVFMLINSSEFNIKPRNLLKRGVMYYLALSENNFTELKDFLISKYNMSMEEATKYCADLSTYLFSLVVSKVKASMKLDTCYLAYYYYKYALASKLSLFVTQEMMTKMNDFLLNCIKEKLDQVKQYDGLKDILNDDFFAKDIIALNGLDNTRLKEVMDDVYDYYVGYISREYENANYALAFNYYRLLTNINYHFDAEQFEQLELIRSNILSRYNPDIYVDVKNRSDRQKHKNAVMGPILLGIFLLQILFVVLYFTHNNVYFMFASLVLMIVFVIILVVDDRREKRIYGHRDK